MKDKKIKCNNFEDREKLVPILAHGGYKVWIKRVGKKFGVLGNPLEYDYYVCFDGNGTIEEED